MVGALTAGALSLVALKLFGMEMPTVPPALVLMALAAILVASVRRRWTAAVALLIGLAEVAALVAGAISGLTDGDPAIAVATAVRAVAVGAIQSREDAIRALDAVAEYFRRHEPSSPIPMIVERARRLVSRSFLEVLADLVPDAVPQARSVGGVPEES